MSADMDLIRLTAAETAASIAGGDVSAVEVAQDHLQLAGEQFEFGVGHRQAGQLGQVGYVIGENMNFGRHNTAA